MTQEWIKQKMKESHENSVKKGFYECDDCKKEIEMCKHIQTYNDDMEYWCHLNKVCCTGICEQYKNKCKKCNGTGKYKNIGQALMLIITELSEAVEAHRKNRFSNFNDLDYMINQGVQIGTQTWIQFFELNIKDTFEDEIADTFIRLFDLCCYIEKCGLYASTIGYKNIRSNKNIASRLFGITTLLSRNYEKCEYVGYEKKFFKSIDEFYSEMIAFSTKHKIDIEKHIEAKMAYNKTRPYKHGKEY